MPGVCGHSLVEGHGWRPGRAGRVELKGYCNHRATQAGMLVADNQTLASSQTNEGMNKHQWLVCLTRSSLKEPSACKCMSVPHSWYQCAHKRQPVVTTTHPWLLAQSSPPVAQTRNSASPTPA